MSNDDLYDDLERKLPPPSEEASDEAKDRSKPNPSEGLADEEAPIPPYHFAATSLRDRRPKSLVDEVQDLQGRVEALERENSVLRRNMGTLYRTAIAELGRKDAQIEELQRELSNHHPSRPSSQGAAAAVSGGGNDSAPAKSTQRNSD
jgi:predicted RNase H-like nuclease (RuvC/YqgF family)